MPRARGTYPFTLSHPLEPTQMGTIFSWGPHIHILHQDCLCFCVSDIHIAAYWIFTVPLLPNDYSKWQGKLDIEIYSLQWSPQADSWVVGGDNFCFACSFCKIFIMTLDTSCCQLDKLLPLMWLIETERREAERRKEYYLFWLHAVVPRGHLLLML